MRHAVLTLILAAACGSAREPITAPRELTTSRLPVGNPGSPFQYPEELWEAQVEGETRLRLFITAGGVVDSVRVERTSGYEAFDAAALAGSRRLRFEPARRGDEPVSAWFILPVKFDMGAAADPAGDPSSQKSVAP
ncbi:MAG TPA: energy transducer TonB [Longimicrobium sp.]|jgi:protein TonB